MPEMSIHRFINRSFSMTAKLHVKPLVLFTTFKRQTYMRNIRFGHFWSTGYIFNRKKYKMM